MATTTMTTTHRPYSRHKKSFLLAASSIVIILTSLYSNTFLFPLHLFLPSPPSATTIAAANRNNVHRSNGYNISPNHDVHSNHPIQQQQQSDATMTIANNGEIIKEEQTRPLTEFKYLTLGSSITWGAGLSNRYADAYPYRLSPFKENISNLAVRAAGPKYPSVCIRSMLVEEASKKNLEKEEEYDVIVLEYYFRGHDGLYILTKRLRQRYPDAIIILLRLWTPVHILWFQEEQQEKEVGVLKDWAIQHSLPLQSDAFIQELLSSNVDMRWPDAKIQNERNNIQNQILQDFPNVHLYTLETHDNPKEALRLYRRWFSDDYSHLSPEGHYHVYQNILRIVYREVHNGPYPLRPRIGTWGDGLEGGGDVCHSWYESGNCPLVHSANVIMEQYDPKTKEKFALSTGVDHPIDQGWIVVENPFQGLRNLILSYLVSGPPPSIYPKTVIVVEPFQETQRQEQQQAENAKKKTTHVINPVSNYYPHMVHIVVTTKVAVIPPGRFKVSWKPLENTGYPFRLVGTAVVGMDVEEGGVLGAAVDFTFLKEGQ